MPDQIQTGASEEAVEKFEDGKQAQAQQAADPNQAASGETGAATLSPREQKRRDAFVSQQGGRKLKEELEDVDQDPSQRPPWLED